MEEDEEGLRMGDTLPGLGETTRERIRRDIFTRPEQNTDTRVRKLAHGDAIEYDDDQYFGGADLRATVAHLGGTEDHVDIVVRTENVHKTYLLGVEGVPALRGVSLSIQRGEFVCIFGTSGGGKTSLLNLLGTIDKPTKGRITICGTRIGSKTTDAELSKLRLSNLGFVFQTFNLLSSLTALENVELPMILEGRLSPAQRRQRARQLLTRVGLGNRMDHVPSQLSGGEQQRVTIARAVANRPDILLLDEPTGDLDSMNTVIAMKLLTELNKEDGITLVMVTHDVGLKFFADRIIWMRDGKIQRVEVVSEAKKRETYEELERDVAAIDIETGHVRSSTGNGRNGGERDVRNPWANTRVRQPADYKHLRGMSGKGDDLRHMMSSSSVAHVLHTRAPSARKQQRRRQHDEHQGVSDEDGIPLSEVIVHSDR